MLTYLQNNAAGACPAYASGLAHRRTVAPPPRVATQLMACDDTPECSAGSVLCTCDESRPMWRERPHFHSQPRVMQLPMSACPQASSRSTLAYLLLPTLTHASPALQQPQPRAHDWHQAQLETRQHSTRRPHGSQTTHRQTSTRLCSRRTLHGNTLTSHAVSTHATPRARTTAAA